MPKNFFENCRNFFWASSLSLGACIISQSASANDGKCHLFGGTKPTAARNVVPSQPLGHHFGDGYHLLNRRFAGGKLVDLTAAIDDLADSGIRSIFISPLGPQSKSNEHGYWQSEMAAIDPQLGNWDDFDALMVKAEMRGVRIVVDVVTAILGHADSFRRTWVDYDGNQIDLGVTQKNDTNVFRQKFIHTDDDPYHATGRNIYREIDYGNTLEAQRHLSQLTLDPQDKSLPF